MCVSLRITKHRRGRINRRSLLIENGIRTWEPWLVACCFYANCSTPETLKIRVSAAAIYRVCHCIFRWAYTEPHLLGFWACPIQTQSQTWWKIVRRKNLGRVRKVGHGYFCKTCLVSNKDFWEFFFFLKFGFLNIKILENLSWDFCKNAS